ncbi:Uncharacterised protein [Mycobacterium tuberculosis]|uniref:Uncharacterized protein n=1 Tax=Mycobacterium tuberculosis TaxID=1773 RepID=A0A655FJX0_MYCTX|nr:Uncharacterised protein [Mycobacterium tuberculosis]CNV82052.1 Uncharacterised protein [Mycobacterium tuberculosis]CNW06593.1 Uncharacterised protein [Mycobacterium tuberculosis]COX37504.1 Uncharacterised protein [Mycobacterium tuberculosis]COZ14484.1 Uncharacterised protein [Mycobacterium tuberculosis]
MQRICSMLSQVPANAIGNRSLAKPGSMPFTYRLEFPARAASCKGLMISSGITCHGYCKNTGPLPTILIPAAKIRR